VGAIGFESATKLVESGFFGQPEKACIYIKSIILVDM
jgi:hypothetical protein